MIVTIRDIMRYTLYHMLTCRHEVEQTVARRLVDEILAIPLIDKAVEEKAREGVWVK